VLRLLVLVLLLANAAFYAWTQGLLDGVVGVRAQGDREPERLSRQVRPENVQILSARAAASMAAANNATCLETGPYAPDQIDGAVSALGALPSDSWRNVRTDVPGVWLVYMGKYPNRDAMLKKADELKRLRIPYEEVHATPELEGGISLGGRFQNQSTADQALADFTQRGVRTARVVLLSAPTAEYTLRIEKATPAIQAKLSGLSGLLGKPFVACPLPKT
jgi:hypothetical protein